MMVKDIIEYSKYNRPVNGKFVLTQYELKSFRGKPGNYIQCDLTDGTGTIRGMIWNNTEKCREWMKNNIVVEVSGEATRYSDMAQISIKEIKKTEEYNPEDFLPSLNKERKKELAQKLISIGDTIKESHCKGIWNWVLDPFLFADFCECPGGVGSVHHNYLGGLLEHTLSVVKICDYLSNAMDLDRDITLTGALLHDIGKIQAYDWNITIKMGDAGRLLHHTALGYGMFHAISSDMRLEKTDPIFLKLAHIIISHHEKLGHVDPMFPEAQAVSQADALDAQIIHAKEYMDQADHQVEGSSWTSYCKLTSRFYYQGLERGQKC